MAVECTRHKMETSSSSSFSSSSSPAKRHDIFLSFRGDSRNNFISHLDSAFRKSGLFSIFKDENKILKGKDKLQKGKDTEEQLMKAIEDSDYAVVVISEKYADSTWCLKEVAKIVECKRNSERIRTIFYKVNVSDVKDVVSTDEERQRNSSFWKALDQHEKNHAKDRCRFEYSESWKSALSEVCKEFSDCITSDTDEANFIEEFVADISSKLGPSIRTIDGLFGMTSRLKKLDSYVVDYSAANNVCFIGIHGMGGVGKTTLAEAYHMKSFHKFDGSCFLANIREVCKKQANGLVDLQKKLLFDILEEDFQIGYVTNGINFIRSRFRAMKVLIILDDVSNLKQLEAFVDSHKKKQGSENEFDKWFGPGSVIIVTTRNADLLTEKYEKYGAECLDDNDSLQLFSWKAFRSIEPPEEFKELSKEVVEYASNLPLALTVLGPLFGSKEKGLWPSLLCRLRNCPEKGIFGILKISFDDLDLEDQHIFLDIACFFRGCLKTYAIGFLDGCGFKSEYGISNLIGRSLLSITGFGMIQGTDEVKAIIANVDETKEYNFEAFSFMKKLRILCIYGSKFDDYDDCVGPELSNNLRCLEWMGFPYNKFPSSFHPNQLVQLNLRYSKIEQLWNNFERLIRLDLNYCTSLKKLPEEISSVTSLQHLGIRRCYRFEKLPDNLEQLKNLRYLDIYHSGIKHLPSSIFLMENLEYVDYEDEGMIKSAVRENIISYRITGKCFISSWFCSRLQRLVLIDCNLTGPEAFPEYFGKLVWIRDLDLSKNPFSVLPSGINGLSKLTTLRLEHCKSLRCLEAELLPSRLEEVYVNYCTSLASFLDPLKPCHLSCLAYGLECTELVRRQDGKMTALASLSRFLQDPYNRRQQRFKFVVPQSDHNELPSWFINQSSTASVTIKLDPNWHSELIGVAIVFCFRANPYTEDELSCNIGVGCSINWKTLPTMKMGFSPHAYGVHYSSCGPCGVRLVYEEDIEELKQVTSQYNNDQKDVQSSHSQSISQLSKLRLMGPIQLPLWTGLRGILDVDDNLELEMMRRCAREDPPNSESNPNNMHFGVFRNYSGITISIVSYCTSLALFLDPPKPCLLSCSAYCLECTELVRRQDGKMTALASLSRFLQDTYRSFINFEFVVPQSDYDLPSWLINQSPTPSNSIKLRGHSKLMGVAMVFCFGANFSFDIIVNKKESFMTIRVDVIGSGTSDHLFLLYRKTPKFFESQSVVDARTFKVSFRNADEQCSSCGPWCCLVYEEDKEELRNLPVNTTMINLLIRKMCNPQIHRETAKYASLDIWAQLDRTSGLD
ncbi:hypothetical protein FNV43_RR08571 [Rhamnella rubrinervis]|uniref:ADP-ribosyl cyclase/cyclic ADP-ribose hydrolase n=1 Tax=Rhamnella rubrinervis TaxID=2594499 RepID=A0A8K0H8V6_9ROSA|nr:hypothetical protein FNV43_RR08571 [Rhamnella rubrinervis]